MWAVLPLKDFIQAKQRLAAVLTPAERRQLFTAMVEDVLIALRAVTGLRGTLVITDDPAAAALARQYDARVMAETPPARGLNKAVAGAAAVLASEGADGILVVHGDLPLITPQALAEVLRAHGAQAVPAVSIVPDAEGLGTNCLVCSPPDVIAFRYGEYSCGRHWQTARTRGVAVRIYRHPALALDVDTPEDLASMLNQLQSAQCSTQTRQMLNTSGIAARLRATESE